MKDEPVMKTLVIDIPLTEPQSNKPTTPPLRMDPPSAIELPPQVTEVISPVSREIPQEPKADLEDIMSKSSTRNGITCDACHRVFPSYTTLHTHHKVTAMCAYWYTLTDKSEYEYIPPSAIHVLVDELLERTVSADDSPLQCRTCHSKFSTKGNLHKHFSTSAVCNRMAYARLKKVSAELI